MDIAFVPEESLWSQDPTDIHVHCPTSRACETRRIKHANILFWNIVVYVGKLLQLIPGTSLCA